MDEFRNFTQIDWIHYLTTVLMVSNFTTSANNLAINRRFNN